MVNNEKFENLLVARSTSTPRGHVPGIRRGGTDAVGSRFATDVRGRPSLGAWRARPRRRRRRRRRCCSATVPSSLPTAISLLPSAISRRLIPVRAPPATNRTYVHRERRRENTPHYDDDGNKSRPTYDVTTVRNVRARFLVCEGGILGVRPFQCLPRLSLFFVPTNAVVNLLTVKFEH